MPPKGSKKATKAPQFTYDYSGMEEGMKCQAESEGSYYSAEVVQVSTSKNRSQAPVKVHFVGYDASYDVWVGGDKLRSKALKKTPVPAKGDKKEAAKKNRSPLEVEMGYWAIRGLGAPLRMILEYKGVKYTDKQYETGEPWFKEDKPKILEKNPLANLPYVVAGETVICQSNSCMSYLGMRLGLNGRDPVSRFNNEQLLCEIFDVRNNMIDLVYPFKKVNRTEEEYKESAKDVCEKPPFGKFEAFLAKAKTDYFSGPKPLTADFHIWEMLDQHKILEERIGMKVWFEDFPLCKAFYDRFRAIDTLQAYFASDAYKLPINNAKMAGAYFA